MAKSIISSPDIPVAGPYSAAVSCGELLFTSGQLPLDPVTGKLVPGGIEAQAFQALTNLSRVLEAGGSKLEAVLKTTVYLTGMEDFPVFNKVYAQFFSSHPPARSLLQAAALPAGARLEIDAVAIKI